MSGRNLPPHRLQRWVEGPVAPILLLAIFFVAGLVSLWGESATFDETAHLPAGLSYWQQGDFRLNPEHPPLAKLWAAFPAWIAGWGEPNYDANAWNGTPVSGQPGLRSGASEWVFGYEAMNGPVGHTARSDPRALLRSGRIAMLLGGLLLGGLVYSWSRELWGPRGAVGSTFLFALSPTMLAHARLVTTDLPTALGFVATLWAADRWRRQPTPPRLAALAACCGAALIIKFSTLLLLPALGLGFSLHLAATPADQRRGFALRLVRWVVPAALLVWAIVWAAYGFRFGASPDGYSLNWGVIGSGGRGPGLEGADLPGWLARLHGWRLLPEAYLYGLAYVLGGAARRLAYLNGVQSIVGWWYYFPIAFGIKTPLSVLGSLGLGLVVVARGALWRDRRLWFPAAGILVYLGVSLASSLNIGHRHLTPIYPLLFVLLGGLVPWACTRSRRILLAVLASIHLAAFVIASPGYLGYFNLIAGGSTGGPRFLLDSNIDWGQDLPSLRGWMDREGIDEVALAYFGTADPLAYGIPHRKILRVHDFAPQMPRSRPRVDDWVAISVNLVHGLYYDEDQEVAEAVTGRRWVTGPKVRAWVALRDQLSQQGRPHPSLLDWLTEEGLLTAQQRNSVEASLLSPLFKRLAAREPEARAGRSIWIYRIGSDDLGS